MNLFNADYNKKKNAFEQGITRIRNKNNNFFLNASSKNTIYDLSDIKSYYNIYEIGNTQELSFRDNSGLPDRIKQDVQDLFNSIWGIPEAKEE